MNMSENKLSKGRKILTSTVKLTKFGLAGLSFASYALLYNWRFALLIIIAIGFHECGHVWAMKTAGIKTKGFYFIPFLGGVTIPEEQYTSYKQNVWVSIMGPVWGCLLAIVTAVIYFLTKNSLFAAAAIWMAALNFFNLLPITPLDGGHIIRAIAFSINQKIGLAFLTLSFLVSAAILATLHIGLWILILIVGGFELTYEAYLRQKEKTDEHANWLAVELKNHYPAPLKFNQLLITVFSYVFLIMVLLKLIIVMKNVPGSDIVHNFLG
jgi:putative peptide zinc metalloprotease protein